MIKWHRCWLRTAEGGLFEEKRREKVWEQKIQRNQLVLFSLTMLNANGQYEISRRTIRLVIQVWRCARELAGEVGRFWGENGSKGES